MAAAEDTLPSATSGRQARRRGYRPLPQARYGVDYREDDSRKQGLRIDCVYATKSVYDRCTQVIHDGEPREWDNASEHMPVICVS